MTLTRLAGHYVEVNGLGAGIFALGLVFGAYATEVFRGAILAVPRGQIEAARALGLRPSAALPQGHAAAGLALCAARSRQSLAGAAQEHLAHLRRRARGADAQDGDHRRGDAPALHLLLRRGADLPRLHAGLRGRAAIGRAARRARLPGRLMLNYELMWTACRTCSADWS